MCAVFAITNRKDKKETLFPLQHFPKTAGGQRNPFGLDTNINM